MKYRVLYDTKARIARHEGGRIVTYRAGDVVELSEEEARRYALITQRIEEPAPLPLRGKKFRRPGEEA